MDELFPAFFWCVLVLILGVSVLNFVHNWDD